MLYISRQSGVRAVGVGLTQIGVSESFFLCGLSEQRTATAATSMWNCSFNGRLCLRCTLQFLFWS